MTRVLVVDDNASVRMMVRMLLEGAGLDVVEAVGGVAALDAAHHTDFDLVICDLFMPDLDGLELIRAIRRDSPQARIVAMSGGAFHGTLDLLPVAQHLGAIEILHKPFTRRVVVEAIERALGSGTGKGVEPPA